ncbi:hypothetical protein [Streptomyces prasinus]|uniref:hypothetical protein n=1 Tax=Streptomyces prasinus TaxID=67345 RepID=UPI0036CCB912
MTTPRRRTVSTELAALAMGVSEATIRKWASRGKITRYGRKQRAEYDLDELLALRERGSPLSAGGRQASSYDVTEGRARPTACTSLTCGDGSFPGEGGKREHVQHKWVDGSED